MYKKIAAPLFAALFMLGAAGPAYCADATTAENFVDDATITAKIKARQAEDEVVRASSISVDTVNGEVQLSGLAKSEHERARAEIIAKSVEGVKSVRNEIVVQN